MGLKPSRRFWSGKRVLMTGHTGFKGSWLSLWLQGLGARLTGFSLPPPTEPSLFRVANVAGGMASVEGDIRNLEHLRQVVAEYRPEIVIHMAAQPLVRYSYAHPVETFSTNVIGTVHVLEAAREAADVKVCISITSDKCYENREWVWGYRENEMLGGRDPYSASKACAELVARSYRDSYFNTGSADADGMALATVRAGNVIGGGDWAEDRLIPDIIRAIMERRAVVVRNPSAIRPWQHVLEPLLGYLKLAERLWTDPDRFCGAWNFGPAEESAQPVSWVVEHLTRRWGGGASWELDTAPNPHEAHYLKLDCSKARTDLGFVPKLDLATALEWVVEWFQAYAQAGNMEKITRQQIALYEAMKGVHAI